MMRFTSIVLAAAVALAAAPVHAEEAARAEAKALAQKGDVEFYAGRCDRAEALWKRAEAAFHAPTLLVRIARCEAQRGRVIAAAATLGAVAGERLAAGAPAAFVAAVEQAKRDLAAVRARIANLRVSVRARGPRVAVEIEIDGVTQPAGATSFPVDPGEHRVRVRAGASLWQSTITLRDGEARTAEVALWAEPEPKPPDVQRRLGIAALGAGGAATAVGAGFAIAALSLSKQLDARCGDDRAHCPPDSAGDIQRVRVFTSAANGAIAGGAALLVTGAITALTARSPAAAHRVRFAASPLWIGLHGEL